MTENTPSENKAHSANDNEKTPPSNPENTSTPNHQTAFPIVGIGASAGGLQAFTSFFKNLPDDPEMAFVIIQHLDPNHESELAKILQNHTAMTVVQAEDQTEIQVNNVYIIPPAQSITLEQGVLHLSPLAEDRSQRAPINAFLQSLANDQGDNAVCLIFSGTGSDGTLGLREIKEQGGVALVQDPDEAEYDEMPRNAINSGLVDLVLPIADLAQKLIKYRQSIDHIQFPAIAEELTQKDVDILHRIFTQLQGHTGINFANYKRSTILRRLQRRMQVNQTVDLPAYLTLLRNNPPEMRALFKNLLISVTNFFRDAEAWQALAETVIPALFNQKGIGEPIRVWVPGCATGEEAYALAILLFEEASKREHLPDLQIFATDLDEDALDFGRRGLYAESIKEDVSPERLQRFFKREGNGYRVRPDLQEIVLFASHNLINDAPFARLDLISCRNLLIYLERDVQHRIFQIFRYALNSEGYLLLGGSESADQANDLFESVQKQHRIYRAKPGKSAMPNPLRPLNVETQRPTDITQNEQPNPTQATKAPRSLGNLHRDLMLQRYAPPSILVDSHYQIHYKFGDIGRYLQHYEGEPSLSLLDNVSSQIRLELRTSLFTAFREQKTIASRQIQFQVDDRVELLNLRIEPLPAELTPTPDETLALVIFEPLPPADAADSTAQADAEVESAVVRQLENELNEVRYNLQRTVEDYETSNEELKTSNEELQSMNEELRSTTEELETSREELRSTNEELTSLNQELKNGVDELNRANSDLENLIAATDIAILFTDSALNLKRYTPQATKLFNVIASDIGRPFAHISHQLNTDTLPTLAGHVLDSLKTVELEIQSKDDRWFLVHIHPYRTLENKIDGVVITLVDITAQMKAEQNAKTRAEQQNAVAELGVIALRGMPFNELVDITVRRVAATLAVDYAKVLQLLPEGEELLLLSGVGWQPGLVGIATVETDSRSQAGYTLQSDTPVIVVDMVTEKRFQGPELLTRHGVVSGLSVIIHGHQGRPFGVFGVHTRQPRMFTREDADFLQAVSNVLSIAIARQQTEAERMLLLTNVQAEQARLRTILQQMPAGIVIARAPSGEVIMANDQVEEITRNRSPNLADIESYEQYPGFHLDGTPLAAEAWPLARAIRTGEVVKDEEIIIRGGDNSEIIVSNFAAPIYDQEGDIVAGVVIIQDITTRKQTEAERDRLVAELKTLTETLEDRVSERTQQLNKRSEQLRATAAALTVAEQRERERISQILHDDLQQLLHASQMQIMLLETDFTEDQRNQLQPQISALEQLNDRMLTTVRSLTVELSPLILEGEGMAEAFAWLADYMQNTYGLKVSVAIEDKIAFASSDLRELIFQMVRELLFNIVKHAEINEARLTMRQQENTYTITVADDGQGFNPATLDTQKASKSGYGLSSIRQRIALFDGALSIESSPNEGTQVTLVFPAED